MKKILSDFTAFIRAALKKCGCSENPYDMNTCLDSFQSFNNNLAEKIQPVCAEDLACSYWIYLYSQNSARQL